MKHVLIVNRYNDEFSDYRKYIDHGQVDVSYISLKECSGLIDRKNSAVVVEVGNLSPETVLYEARRIHNKHPLDYVIAFSEYDLDAAALVRTELNIRGSQFSENQLVRNKASMKAALAGSTVHYPQYRKVSSREEAEAFCREYGYPAILKPQVGAASNGVVKIERQEDILALTDFTDYEVEEYILGDIYHIDAILSGLDMPYFKISKYINTCLDFRNGQPLGSVTIDEPAFIAKAKSFTQEICTCLNIKNQAIHLEVIESRGELVFLEIGGRVGGGEIPFVAIRNEGIDLFELWMRAAVGEEVPKVANKITGFLMMPNPFQGGFTFDPQMKLFHPLLTWQKVLFEGKNNGFSYENIPARLHFLGETQIAVEEAIRECMTVLSKAIRPA